MKEYWTDKKGNKIAIKNMSNQYIQNCIKAIKEQRIIIGCETQLGYTADGEGDGIIYDFIDTSQEYIKAFENELIKREKVSMK